jgi:signal transduction histidine kinase/ActR/RegA family two-component response regulator
VPKAARDPLIDLHTSRRAPSGSPNDGHIVHFHDTVQALIAALHSEIRELRARNAALEALVEEARAKDEFIAVLSHELRGPLAPIRSALQLMQLRGDNGVTREREIVDRQVGNLVRLVDDLLDESRIATGKIELRRERVDLADVIEMAVEIAAPLIRARGHALHVAATRGVSFVDGDPVRLAQVVSNLLSNAAKYTERNGRVSVDLCVNGWQAVLSVRDTGIGIDAELLPRVFDRGVQGAHCIGGLGLGLTIVRALVELHGGSISAHSDGRACGSEFRVALPLAGAPASAGSPAAPEQDAPASEAAPLTRLLIVEDDADLADTLAELLTRRGFLTQVARDGEEAIRAFARFRPQAALIDISLPVMNGRDLARRLRAEGTEAKLIALSGYGRREDEEASLASGFDLHLVKPVRPDLIAAHLRGIADPERESR